MNSNLRPRIRPHLTEYVEREAKKLGTDDLGAVVNRMLEDHLLYLGKLDCVKADRVLPQSSSQPTEKTKPAKDLADEYADLLNEAL